MVQEFEDRARALRDRASTAGSDMARKAYLFGAEKYEELGAVRGARQRTEPPPERLAALEAQLEDLQHQLAATRNAVTILTSLLRRCAPGLVQELATMRIEPHPETPSEQVEDARIRAERIRQILGEQTPNRPAG